MGTIVPGTIYFSRVHEPYGFLSNFYLEPMHDEQGREWKSAEHFYQAHKALAFDEFMDIMEADSPAEAKRKGNECISCRPDWNGMKEHFMAKALELKFKEGTDLSKKLVSTYPHELVEYTPWRDRYWGVDPNLEGKNRLGVLLMNRRKYLREFLGEKV